MYSTVTEVSTCVEATNKQDKNLKDSIKKLNENGSVCFTTNRDILEEARELFNFTTHDQIDLAEKLKTLPMKNFVLTGNIYYSDTGFMKPCTIKPSLGIKNPEYDSGYIVSVNRRTIHFHKLYISGRRSMYVQSFSIANKSDTIANMSYAITGKTSGVDKKLYRYAVQSELLLIFPILCYLAKKNAEVSDKKRYNGYTGEYVRHEGIQGDPKVIIEKDLRTGKVLNPKEIDNGIDRRSTAYKRRSHYRIYHRGTEEERTIWINETWVHKEVRKTANPQWYKPFKK